MRNTMVTLGGVGVFAACVAAAGLLTSPINQQRKDLNLTLSDDLYDLPPEQAFLQMSLGVFRGVGINAAWIRAENLKNEGNYSEAVQLGEWITKLQPKFAQVWEFVSWNQAYNISVGTHTEEERWFWVKSGIDLLQRKGGGLDANPSALRLYQQLAWIYHHKVGMFQDAYNWYYKQQLSADWNAILGEPPRDREEYVAWLGAMADAPADEAELPEDARRLVTHMRDGYDSPIEVLRAYTVANQLVGAEEGGSEAAMAEEFFTTEDGDDEALFAERLVPAESFPEWSTEEDQAAAIAFLRRSAIESEAINMELDAMLRDAEAFGAIDYRHPAGHALYWARRGLETEQEVDDRSREGLSNLRRQILNSLDQLARQGRVVVDPLEGYVNYTPDWPFWKEFDAFYNRMADEEIAQRREAGTPEDELEALRTERLYGSGYRNRMDAAIADAELYGDRDTAVELLEIMRDRYADSPVAERYQVSLDEFLERQFEDTIENPDAARATMSALLVQAIASLHLTRDPDRYDALIGRARELHEGWRRINPDPNDPLYQEVPDFPGLFLEAIGSFITGKSGQVVTSNVPVPVRARVWGSLNPVAQASLLRSNFGPQMYQQVFALGYEPQSVFPPPPGFGGTPLQKDITEEQRRGESDEPRAETERN